MPVKSEAPARSSGHRTRIGIHSRGATAFDMTDFRSVAIATPYDLILSHTFDERDFSLALFANEHVHVKFLLGFSCSLLES